MRHESHRQFSAMGKRHTHWGYRIQGSPSQCWFHLDKYKAQHGLFLYVLHGCIIGGISCLERNLSHWIPLTGADSCFQNDFSCFQKTLSYHSRAGEMQVCTPLAIKRYDTYGYFHSLIRYDATTIHPTLFPSIAAHKKNTKGVSGFGLGCRNYFIS